MSQQLLSVCLITYNHEKYIRQAIDSIIMQQVGFEWELVIADDFSKDATREILLDYKNKYPKLIKLILQEKNVGPGQNFNDLISSANSKYIAYIEGDDYWTNPNKLQKQVDFLEKNHDYSLCFHNAILKQKDQSESNFAILENRQYFGHEILQNWLVHTGSIVFRNSLPMITNPKYYYGDIILLLYAADIGKIWCFEEPMSVYRKHDGGITHVETSKIIGDIKKFIIHHQEIKKNFKGKYDAVQNKTLSKAYLNLSKQYLKNMKVLNFIKNYVLSFCYSPVTFLKLNTNLIVGSK